MLEFGFCMTEERERDREIGTLDKPTGLIVSDCCGVMLKTLSLKGRKRTLMCGSPPASLVIYVT